MAFLSLKFKSPKFIQSIITLCFAIFVISGLLIIDSRMNPSYAWEDVLIDETALRKYEEQTFEDTSALFTDIYFNDEKLIYDQATDTFYYSAIEDEAEFESKTIIRMPSISFKAALKQSKPKLALYTGNTTSTAPSCEPKLIIKSGGSISISDFVFTTLPVMNINVSAETVKELGLDDTYAIDNYTSVTMSLYDNSSDFDDSYRLIETPAKIHTRGGTTIGFPQKSYRLSLLENGEDHSTKSKKNLLGLREDDDWILYSPYSDYEKIRTVFSMNLWHDMAYDRNEWNAPNSNEYKYIELFINNRYHGLYALTYPIDNKQFDIQDEETLFKKKDWSGTEYSLDLEPTDSGDLWLPGYSLEDGSMEGFEQLHELYYEMAYSEDPNTIRSTCDMDDAIDLWLFYKLTQAVDNVYTNQVKNLYSATKLSDTGIDGYKLLLCPWDMDQTFGNRYVDGQGNHGITSYFNSPDYDLPIEWSPVYFLMECGDEDILTELQARYDELRNTVWSDDAIKASIAKYEDAIYNSGAYMRTMNRWGDGNYYAPDKKLDDFENYLLDRLQCMDEYMDSFY